MYLVADQHSKDSDGEREPRKKSTSSEGDFGGVFKGNPVEFPKVR